MQAKEAQFTEFEVNHVNCYLPKNLHLYAKNVITLAATERANREHTHTLFFGPFFGPFFWTLGVPLESWTQFDLPITTTLVLPTSYPKIIILALLLTEILRLFEILFRVFYYK